MRGPQHAQGPQHGHRSDDDQALRRRLGREERDRAEQPAQRERAAAARERSPRAKVDLYVNEYSGTVTWRTRMTPAEKRHRAAERPGASRQVSAEDRKRAQAAALRSVGLDPKRSKGTGAVPIPAHPGTVLAAAHTSVAGMTPEQLNSHAARVSALRSQLQGDTARAGRMPTSSAARLRSGLDAARVHSLRVEGASSARELAQRHQQPRHPRAGQRQSGPAAPHR
ncbi:hypothetical protein [Streptomyces sp. CA-132043]|uniref:hypothetical protein n=1 Tax=Streptomyces sp. CA-132043 TaxID=3240048 RepID=UPI003D8FA896